MHTFKTCEWQLAESNLNADSSAILLMNIIYMLYMLILTYIKYTSLHVDRQTMYKRAFPGSQNTETFTTCLYRSWALYQKCYSLMTVKRCETNEFFSKIHTEWNYSNRIFWNMWAQKSVEKNMQIYIYMLLKPWSKSFKT